MSWVEDWKADIRALKAYTQELERRHEIALGSLAELAQGVGKKPDYNSNEKSDWMQNKAAFDLVEITKQPLRKKPYVRSY